MPVPLRDCRQGDAAWELQTAMEIEARSLVRNDVLDLVANSLNNLLMASTKPSLFYGAFWQ
jgi:hypothetical protein